VRSVKREAKSEKCKVREKKNMKTTAIKEIQGKIHPLLKRYDVAKAAIFGSFAAGDYNEDSDIDILVEFNGRKSLLDLAGLKIELEELLARRVDLLTYNSLSPLIKEGILSQQEVIL